jgi:signal transduction histidine kinase
LLDVSRISSGGLALTTDDLELSETVSQVVASLRGAAASARCDLSFTTTGAIRGSWDRLRIEQMVMNLLSNALKYGAGAPVKVTLSTDGSHAVLEVADKGPGIPAKDLDRIFGRFERAASFRHYGGLGLGLYVTREVVAGQGGTIDARNLPGGGACFTVRLPLEVSASAKGTETVVGSRD